MKRNRAEMIFLWLFVPLVVLVYMIKSYPKIITGPLGISDPFGDFFFLFGKSPNFWYQSLYTGIIATISLGLLVRGKNPYGNRPGKKPLSSYQRSKFTSILLIQFVMFYFLPFVLPMIKSGQWADRAPKNEIVLQTDTQRMTLDNPIRYSSAKRKKGLVVYVDDVLQSEERYEIVNKPTLVDDIGPSRVATALTFAQPQKQGQRVLVSTFSKVHKMSHVYVSPAFFSSYAFGYMFLFIPIFVWFFGKRYCSWVCACGNLAETIGTTRWGSKWVVEGTPRGEKSLTLESIQVVMLGFSLVIGVSAILNVYHVISPGAHDRLWYMQDFLTDFVFGSIIGVGVYPFLGTRIWCRYGCPMAQWMKLFGRWSRARYAVIPNDKCKGIGACTKACPMGIPVDKYAHVDRKPIEISFGLHSTPCVGCGGCVDACPLKALSFQTIGKKTVIATKQP